MPGLEQSIRRLSIAGLLAILLAACAASPVKDAWVRTELYFGQSRPDGSLITTEEWQGFVEEVITPKFPAGLSIVEASGQWRNAQGRIEREPSKLLILLHRMDAHADAHVEAIRLAYRQRFNQEAVLKVTAPVEVAF